MRLLDLVVLGILLLLGILYSRYRQPKKEIEEVAKPAIKRSSLQAAKLMEEQGFRILAYHPEVPVSVWIDDRLYNDKVFGDLLVEKEGIRYLATVKNEKNPGKVGSNLNERLELTKLHLLHDVDGIIWVDLPRRRLHQITFEPGNELKSSRFRIPWGYIIAAVVGALFFWGASLLITRGW